MKQIYLLLVAHPTLPTLMNYHDRVWYVKWYSHILAHVERISYVRDKVAT